MDVTSAEQARIAEEAGAVAVMALERGAAGRHPQGGPRGADGRPDEDSRDPYGGDHPGDSEVPDRAFRRRRSWRRSRWTTPRRRRCRSFTEIMRVLTAGST